MAGNFEDPNSPSKVRTGVGLGVDLVDQLGHGGLPIGHGGDGFLGVVECRGIRTDNNVGRAERFKNVQMRASNPGMVFFRLLRSVRFEAEGGARTLLARRCR